MATTCQYHCSPCGRHFHSLRAFDVHHTRDAEDRLVCLDPLDLVDLTGKERLEKLTDDGECRVYSEHQTGVTIWIMAGSRERLGQIYGKGPVDLPGAA